MCGLSFPKTEYYFYISKVINGVTYYRGKCKECYKINKMNYYDKNRGKILDKASERYKAHKRK